MHLDWVAAFSSILTDLQTFVKKFHTTGLVWTSNGADAKSFIGTLYFFCKS